MTRWVLVLAALQASLALGCNKKKADSSPKSAEATAPAVAPSPCDSLLASEVGRELVTGLLVDGAGLEVDDLSEQALLEHCHKVPAKVLSCYQRFDLESAACESAINSYLGLRDATPKQKGPAALWSFALEEDWLDLVGSEDGLVAVAYEDKVVAIKDGKALWERDLVGFSGRLAMADSCVIAPTEAAIVCLKQTDGSEAWQARRLPAEAASDSRPALGMTAHAGRAMFVGAYGVVYALDLARCAKRQSCVSDTGVVADEFSDFYGFAFAEDGHWMLGESDRVRLFDVENKERWARAGYATDQPSASGNRFVVLSGKDILLVDAAACVEDASSCAKTVVTLREEDGYSAIAVPGGGVAVVESAGVVAGYGGKLWKLDANNDAPLLLAEGQLYSVGRVIDLEDLNGPPTLRAIDPDTGETLWMTTFSGRSSLEEPVLIRSGDALAVAFPESNQLHRVPLEL